MSDDVRKIAAWVPITAEMAMDAASSRSLVDEMFDHWSNPWKYPDPRPLPAFDLFPLLTRATSWAHAVIARREPDG